MGKTKSKQTSERLLHGKVGIGENGRESSNINFGTGGDTQIKSSVDNSRIEHCLIYCGGWVFLSNRIVFYWPFSQTYSSTLGRYKHFNFTFPTLGVFLSVLYITLNLLYIVHYFYNDIGSGNGNYNFLGRFDFILITTWDLMVVVSVAAHRLYGIVRLSKFQQFWQEIVNVTTQIIAISSERETETKFHWLRRWTFKWFLAFTLFGIIDCSAVIYHYKFDTKDKLSTILFFEYLEIVICMHNSSALIMIFFMKIITYGFTCCKQKLNQFSIILPFEYEMVSVTHDKFSQYRQMDSQSRNRASSSLRPVLQLIHDLEGCVSSFNKLFAFRLFLETVLSFWQVMFSMYFLHITPVDNFAFAVNMAVPILTYPVCLMCLCVAASALTVECQDMAASFQKLPLSVISQDDAEKIQILVTRMTSTPPAIQVSQLFTIRESLLGSALNALATYFIVLVQIRQISNSKLPPVRVNGTELRAFEHENAFNETL